MKLTAGTPLLYVQVEIYLKNKPCRRKAPYHFYSFYFPEWKQTELMD